MKLRAPLTLLAASIVLVLMMTLSECSFSIFFIQGFLLSSTIWTVTLFVILWLAWQINVKGSGLLRWMYLGAFLATLALFCLDSDPADSLFFEIEDPGNGIALLIYGAIILALFTPVALIDKKVFRA